MEVVSDLHLHSKYSRAVSQNMVLPIMDRYAKEKGLNLLSASDFTHPLWLKEIKHLLEETEDGIYSLKGGSQTLFLLSTEIASIYKQGDKLRRIHNLVFAPNFDAVDKIIKELKARGANLMADGRPIIGLSAKHLLELILGIDARAMLVPCHVWTPHFGVYGSKSGFDSLAECFQDLAQFVYGIETGISSDPEMNWRMEELSNRSILSFSDAHSPANMSREATAFELTSVTYENIRRAISRTGGNSNRISYTVEFYPEEGKYHFSGHRNCKVVIGPEDILKDGSICPVCHRELTEGVAVRIEQLAGGKTVPFYEEKMNQTGLKWYTDKSKNHPPYVKLVRLQQIIGESIHSPSLSVKVKAIYDKLIEALGSELDILLKKDPSEIETVAGEKVAEGVRKARNGNILIEPGYDGEYGVVKIFSEQNADSSQDKEVPQEKKEQMGLF